MFGLVIVSASFASAAKLGADVNYFLSLRLVAGLGVAALWVEVSAAGSTARYLLTLGIALTVYLAIPGTLWLVDEAVNTQAKARYFTTADGVLLLEDYGQMIHLASDPQVSLLTNRALLAAYQKERAPFVDPWLFRLLVETGRIQPTEIVARLRAGNYDHVITSEDLFDPNTDPDTPFGLPRVVANAVRTSYQPAGPLGDLFHYVPRRGKRP